MEPAGGPAPLGGALYLPVVGGVRPAVWAREAVGPGALELRTVATYHPGWDLAAFP